MTLKSFSYELRSRRLRFGALVMILAAFDGLPVHAQSKQDDWAGRPYDYLIVDQDLRTVLEEFGRNNGIRTLLSAAVQGRVRGNMRRSSARAFLDAVTGAYGLDWYFDGTALFVTNISESRTKQVDIQGQALDEVIAKLRAADLYDGRFQLRPGPSAKSLSVAGPPRFVEAVSAAIVASAPSSAEAPSQFVVTVFQGAGGPGERTVFAVPRMSKQD